MKCEILFHIINHNFCFEKYTIQTFATMQLIYDVTTLHEFNELPGGDKYHSLKVQFRSIVLCLQKVLYSLKKICINNRNLFLHTFLLFILIFFCVWVVNTYHKETKIKQTLNRNILNCPWLNHMRIKILKAMSSKCFTVTS